MTTTKTELQVKAKLATSLPLETSREYAERLLSDGNFAMNEKKSNEPVFRAGQRDQVRMGRRAASAHEKWQGVRAGWDAEAAAKGTMSAAQIAAVTEFPTKAAIQAIPADQVVKMKAEDPAKYNRYRLASATLGVIDPALVAKLNTPDAVEPNELLQPIPTAAAEKLGLDPTLKLNKLGMDRVLQEFAKKVADEAIAAVSVE